MTHTDPSCDPRALPDPRVEPTIGVGRAARILGVSRATAYEACRAGTIPSLRLGRRLVVPTARFLADAGLTVVQPD